MKFENDRMLRRAVLLGLFMQVCFAPIALTQKGQPGNLLFSAGVGPLLSPREDYNYKSYKPNLGVALGPVLTLRLWGSFYIYGKVVYFVGGDVSVTCRFPVYDSQGNLIEFRESHSRWQSSLWLTNIGCEYAIHLGRNYRTRLNGGRNYTHALEKNEEGKRIVDGSAVGYFVGLGLDKQLRESRLLLWSELQYSKANRPYRGSGIGVRKSLMLSLGLRYRLF